MGKPSDRMRPGSDAISLHTQPGDRFLDDDAPELEVDDLPPLYDDVAEARGAGDSSSAPLLSNPAVSRSFPGMVPYFSKDDNSGNEFYLSKRLDEDPKLLEKHVEFWGQQPPRTYVRLRGTHKQETQGRDGKKERQDVTDFDVQVELTPYLYSDPVNRVAMREIRTVDNSEKVRRGTVLAKRAPGAKAQAVRLEDGPGDKPTLAEWCHRYYASHAGLKCFTLRRRMVGFNEEEVKHRLEALVRDTNYRGHLSVTFPVHDEYVKVYNECRTNRWRLTAWIIWMFTLTLMFLFSWPYLFFRTKCFEVVTADWAYSVTDGDGRKKYVSISEDQLYNLWGRAISRAVLGKRLCVLDQQDLIAAEGAMPVFANAAEHGPLGILRAGVTAMNEVNRQLGWGYDS